MKVAMLAAGVGARLHRAAEAAPKALLRFGGETLLARHLALLRRFGLEDVTLVVGHRAELIERELRAIGATDMVTMRFNPDYRESSLLSLWTAREAFLAGRPVLYMDADVLYDWRLLDRLLRSPHANCLLVDRDLPAEDDPLKVCIRDGRVVEFHKRIRAERYDEAAEWVGFARFEAATAAAVAGATGRYVRAGRTEAIYEEPIRDVILSSPAGSFGCEDVTGLPWIEIDFPEDLNRARTEIYPRLMEFPDAGTPRDRASLGPAAG